MTCVNPEMAKAYWELGNQLTGFAFVSQMGVILAASQSSRLQAAIKKNWKATATSFIVGMLIYLGLIFACYRAETALDPSHDQLLSTVCVRMVIVFITTALGVWWVVKWARVSSNLRDEK